MQQPPYAPGPPYAAGPQYPAPQQAPAKKGMSTCLIIAIVLGVLGAIGAVVVVALLVLGVYGTQKYLASAKSAEAKNSIGAMMRGGVAAFEREDVGPNGKTVTHRVCGTAITVPREVPKGVKYQPSATDFETGDDTTGWKCLRFAMTSPIYYQYAYEKGAGTGKSGATASGFEGRARGDLNGDGKTSLFARGADVRNGAVVLSTEMYIENELE